jgi:putative DNA methylase
MTYHKKLIEVALPLEAINIASSREKSIRHGHPSTLHLWWARRPLAAARAVIFSQMVDDPSEYVDELLADPTTRSAAEKAYRTQLKTWEARKVVFDKAKAAGMSASSNPDPGAHLTLENVAANLERDRLFSIIEDLVIWENTTNEKVLQKARDEIWRSWRRTCTQNADHPRAKELFNPDKLPAFHDPFAGGGSIPLEAQRLGLEAYASDLNPVAVLINKAMIEIPPKFTGNPPVNPKIRKEKLLISREWVGTQGLAEDIHYYGHWLQVEAEKRLSNVYPKILITEDMVKQRTDLKVYIGQKLTVIAWLWARTVKSPNPAFAHVDVPLAASFILSTKPGKEAWVDTIIENSSYRFVVKVGKPPEKAKDGTKLARGSFRCLFSNVPIRYEYIDNEANGGRMKERLMAIVAEGDSGRVYLSPTFEHETVALTTKPKWKPELPSRGTWASNAQGRRYGFRTFGDYFTPRQLLLLSTMFELTQEVTQLIKNDMQNLEFKDPKNIRNLSEKEITEYTNALSLYLCLAVDRIPNAHSNLTSWISQSGSLRNTFARQAIPMIWDYAEANPFSNSTGNIKSIIDAVIQAINNFPVKPFYGYGIQNDAQTQSISADKIISTDPPYYSNVGYADLSDFFYVWLRRSLCDIFPDLFITVAVPKAEELVAEAYRHGGKAKAETFFLNGMIQALKRLSDHPLPDFPVTIYYAFKQTETTDGISLSRTGWETFLEAVIQSGFSLTGTWPIRTEKLGRTVSIDTNSLASSIVLVCRKRLTEAPTVTRRDFINSLKVELPIALSKLQAGNIAPVDLAQAAIGPGMAIYTRYTKVLDAQGKPISVRQALVLINQTLDEALAEQEGDFDADTRWALAWFEQSGFSEGDFGIAEILSKAKDTSVNGMVTAGIITSSRGKVRLLKPAELPEDWDPITDKRLTAWEMVHHLIRLLEASGESSAAEIVAKLGSNAEIARELCYRLYTICERKKLSTEALSYNGLVQSWPEITRLAREGNKSAETQTPLF